MRLSLLEGLSWQNQMSTIKFVDLKEQTQCKHLFYTSPHFPTKKVWIVNKGACHTMALPFTLKNINAKEELWRLKYFTMQKIIIFKKSSKIKKPKSFKILL
jgi:hypothetical protein